MRGDGAPIDLRDFRELSICRAHDVGEHARPPRTPRAFEHRDIDSGEMESAHGRIECFDGACERRTIRWKFSLFERQERATNGETRSFRRRDRDIGGELREKPAAERRERLGMHAALREPVDCDLAGDDDDFAFGAQGVPETRAGSA